MSHTHGRVVLHLVWSTYRRTPWIDERVEAALRASIAENTTRSGSQLLCFGAWTDHVHVLAVLGRTTSVSDLMRAVKGGSAHALGRSAPELAFRWQEGYGVFSVSEGELPVVSRYVLEQRTRHRERLLVDGWELPSPKIEPSE